MQLLLATPLPVRLALVFVIAACAASLANWATYEFAWQRRLRSPWQRPPEGAGPRGWLDCLPIIGWFRLRRESSLHGSGHWVRPMLIELLFALGMAWLYWWETVAYGLVAGQAAAAIPGGTGALNMVPLAGPLHAQFFAHAVLATFMLAATSIDIDDRIIPDMVTVPGTLLGLALATLLPLALLPQFTQPIAKPVVGEQMLTGGGAPAMGMLNNRIHLEPVHLAAASEWPPELGPPPKAKALAIGLGCYWLWCFAFVRRRWLPRKGIGKAVQFYFARVGRDWWTRPLREVTLLGTIAVLAVWWWGGPAWVGLLTSLVGLVGSGGVVWVIRVFAGAALRKEAMGFGDVLLMMMVGTLIGWQAGVMVFFLAPFAALAFGIVQLLLRRENELPYGPFLCAATLFVIVRWDAVWLKVAPMFSIPWLVPCVLLVCLVLCGLILTVWQAIKTQIWGDDDRR